LIFASMNAEADSTGMVLFMYSSNSCTNLAALSVTCNLHKNPTGLVMTNRLQFRSSPVAHIDERMIDTALIWSVTGRAAKDALTSAVRIVRA
jgi:hypothetical protein